MVRNRKVSTKTGNGTGGLLSPVLFNVVLWGPTSVTGQERKGIVIRKQEVKLLLFIGNMILNVENPKELKTTY